MGENFFFWLWRHFPTAPLSRQNVGGGGERAVASLSNIPVGIVVFSIISRRQRCEFQTIKTGLNCWHSKNIDYFSAEQLVQRRGGVARCGLLPHQAVHLRGLGHHGQAGRQQSSQCQAQEVSRLTAEESWEKHKAAITNESVTVGKSKELQIWPG